MKKHLITSALPYANGPIHFGHICGVYLPADIFTRHLRLKGEEVLHICGSDEHGVAIMQNAQKKKKNYQDYVNHWHKEHKSLFDALGIHFNAFGQTSSEIHKLEVLAWFKELYDKGLIEKKTEQQLQCQSCHQNLPDRFVEGTCYVCGYEKARGDECPSCGTWIDPIQLKDPECQFCHSHDIKAKDVDQWYLMLTKFEGPYKEWLQTKEGMFSNQAYKYLTSLTKEKMVDRAITRDLDWGIDVPLEEAKGKKLYVWFDAPIGYVSNTRQILEQNYQSDWWNHPETTIYNFIGKDNVIFHGLIFPVMSMASKRAKPVTYLCDQQFLNLEGKQFSKSQGHYIDAMKAFHQFGQTNLRYYLTTLIPEQADTSFSWDGFVAKVNNELANNIGNLVNRSMSFLYKNYKDEVPLKEITPFKNSISQTHENVLKALDQREYRKALAEVMSLGQEANQFFTEQKPWDLFNEDRSQCQMVLSQTALYIQALSVMLRPFLPELSQKIFELFYASEDDSFYASGDLEKSLLDHIRESEGLKLLKKPKALIKKIDVDTLQEIKEKLK